MQSISSNNILVLRRNINSISIEIQSNDNNNLLDKTTQPITLQSYYEHHQFNKTVDFFIKYMNDSLITFLNEKKSIELFINLMEHRQICSGFIKNKDNSFFIKIDNTNYTRTILSSGFSHTKDLLQYFKNVYTSFDDNGILKVRK